MIGDSPNTPPSNSGPPPLPSARLVEVPEAALQALLQGSGQTVEEFLRANRTQIQTGREFQKRANAAKWSRLWLAASTFFCLLSLISGRDFEDLISLILLGSMTCVEFKVRDWFLKGDARGAIYGYWNQTLFAALFLIYGAYHFFTASTPQSATEMLDASYAPLVLQLSRIFYGVVGLVGAAGQYALALYYKRSLRQSSVSI